MITERILKYLEYKGITKYKFCKDLGLSNGFLEKPREISTDKYANILVYFPDISPAWLLTGEGEMLKKQKNTYQYAEEGASMAADPPVAYAADKSPGKSIPLIPLDAIGGFANGNNAQVMEYECAQYVVPDFKGADFLIPVKGSSMYPKYASGDIVACKRLPLDTFFQWNKVYVIDSEQGVLIKRVKQGDDKDHILLVSENSSYEPFNIRKDQITSLAIVIGVIRLE
jgi:phage repressor protein C with HTH and peptisase S24 domain